MIKYLICPGGEIGRHKGLKIPRLYGRAGSIPAPGTKIVLIEIIFTYMEEDLKDIKKLLAKIYKTLLYVFFIIAFFALLYFGLLIYLGILN